MSRQSREEKPVSGQMQSYIRPRGEGIRYLRALMKSALPLLNKTSASQAVSQIRAGGSRADHSGHQRDYTSPRAVGFFTLSTQPACRPAHPQRSRPSGLAGGVSSKAPDTLHPGSTRPTRSAHSCSPPRLPSDSTRGAPAAPGSIGSADRLSSSPNVGSLAHRG